MKRPKKKTAPSSTAPADAAAAEEKFKSDLLIRGEAAKLDKSGKLPLNATHEIVEENKKDPTKSKIVRRRMKLY